jgi:subfamily B ATP-binding cassette protein HlyB/CyaB
MIVMAWYSVFLTLIVMAAFPFFMAISACLTPVFPLRLDEKFNRGAENQIAPPR